MILYLGSFFCPRLFFIGDNGPLTNSPQVLMSSVPNYLFHRSLLWLSPMGNHETDVLVWPCAGGFRCQEQVASPSYMRPQTAARKLGSAVIKGNMVLYGEGTSHQRGTSVGGGSWKSLSRRGKARTHGHQRRQHRVAAAWSVDSGARPSGYKACLWFACCPTSEGKLYNLPVSSFLYKVK